MNKYLIAKGVVCPLVLTMALGPFAWTASKLDLNIETLARGPALVGYAPQDVRWSGDSRQIFFGWKQAADSHLKDFDTYMVNRDGSGLRKLSEDEAKAAPPISGAMNHEKTQTVYSRDADLFVYDHASGKTKQVTKTADAETDPHFLRDSKRIYFTRSGNLFVQSLEDGELVQMTDIRPAGSAPPAPAGGGRPQSTTEPPKGTDSQEFLKKEEKDLLAVIRDRAMKREEDEARKKKENPRKPFILQARQSVTMMRLTPDEKYVVAAVAEAGEGSKNAVIPNYVTEDVYTGTIPSRAKVGDTPQNTRLALLNVQSGEVKWVDHGLKETIKGEKDEKPKEVERSLLLTMPYWSEDGTKAVMLGRSAENKDRWIFALDPVTGKTRILMTHHDDAWVDGPGAFTIGWMKGDDTIYYQSERDGYSHVYVVGYKGGEPRQLTSGKWEVLNAELSRDKSQFYLVTSEIDPGERQFYMMDAAGGQRVRITSMSGQYQSVVSPDEKYLATSYSTPTRPPELYVQENRAGAPAMKLTSSPAPEFWTYPWLEAPQIAVPARDGVKVPGHLYKPANFKRGGPAVIFVHGAGYLQNVHRGWSNYYRETMFSQFLMNHGYIALDVDYRGSAGYGRDWRTAIYRHMGGKDLDDELDAARWLVKEHGVDPKRIGIYGGSYGGFITLMALFTQPDVFAAGAALRPVTDWAHYNQPYTSNILNLPQKDAEAYKQSSPIYFAAGLKGGLLICHGVVDTNVHFQDTVRLVQKLIELHKENWETAIYPVEDHGFVEASSWADEYKRIFKLFEKNLK